MTEKLTTMLNVLSKLGKEVNYPRNYILQKEGQLATNLWLVRRGLIRYFYFHQDKEYSGWFDIEGDVIGSIYSVVGMGPAQETIQLLEDSELIEIALDVVQSSPIAFNAFKAEILQHYFLALESRIKFFQCLEGKERYQYLLEQQPQLVQRVPLKLLSSFIGLTPESLSRIRRTIT
jgi:CRP-like cAMP-binding protein